MATVETIPWDPADTIETRQDVADYLEAVYEEDDPGLILDAVLDDIKRASCRHGLTAKWGGTDSPLGAYIREESQKSLESYRTQPNLVAEHANTEEDTARGGYADRQIVELVQNAADTLSKSDGEHIWVRLTPTHLYCADNGLPIDQDGARAILFSHLSSRRGTSEIGRFGLGFKSVLRVTDTPEFFSASGSFRFDRKGTAKRLSRIAPDLDRYPVLRMAEPIAIEPEIEADPDLREMSYWATNVVRLPLKPDTYESLAKQITDFPAEFLLFVEHVGRLILQTDEMESARIISLTREGGEWILDDAGRSSRWLVEKRLHQLSSDAKADSRSLDDADEVPIWWAVPLNRLTDPGKFWAFFPTLTQSVVSGILNAPWKTNEDRQNLLTGAYNDELIEAAVNMVADVLPRLSTDDDPARHLDALPRRREAWDGIHSYHLRRKLEIRLTGRKVVPDQSGELQKPLDVSYPPNALGNDALERWAKFDHRPNGWVHHRALTRNRLARLEGLMPFSPVHRRDGSTGYERVALSRASIAQWLEALVNRGDANSIEASKAAIQTAALISGSTRTGSRLGRILFTANEQWTEPYPDIVRLRGDEVGSDGMFVHPQLEDDPETLSALKTLGLRPATSETAFRDIVRETHWRSSQGTNGMNSGNMPVA